MKRAAVTRILLATVVGTASLTAFSAPNHVEAALAAKARMDKARDHAVLNAVIADLITGPRANVGVVIADSTIAPLPEEQITDKKSEFILRFFPSHAQLVSMTGKDFLKAKPRMKIERVQLDTRIKIDFASTEALKKIGLSMDAQTDSSWRVFRAAFPTQSSFLAMSLPGYDSNGDLALVSYYWLCGDGCYQKGYVFLERNQSTNKWSRLHRAITISAG